MWYYTLDKKMHGEIFVTDANTIEQIDSGYIHGLSVEGCGKQLRFFHGLALMDKRKRPVDDTTAIRPL